MSIIECRNVTYVYDENSDSAFAALRGLTCDIEQGEFVVVLGHNGSGKSTFAKLLNGLFLPTEGSVTVFGLDTADEDNLFDIRKQLGVVFQNPDNQMIASVIEDDVAFGPENIGLPSAEIDARVDWALEAVGMKEFRKGTPFRLSGGQKQRIAIAGVLALKPKVLVLDESTSMLDPEGRASIMEILHKLNREEGITVIAITHYMEEAIRADKILVINEGEVGYLGDKRIFDDPDVMAKFGLELPIASGVAQDLKASGILLPSVLTSDELVEALCRLK